jgi:tagatose 1,6-diphosphate aldolase
MTAAERAGIPAAQPPADAGTRAYPTGLRRGLDACATPRGVFTVLALDHRQNLRREIRPDDPDSVSVAEMAELKRDVVRSLAQRVSGVLLDPEFGAPRCIEDGSLPGDVGLIVAIEATGYDGPSTARRSRVLEGWSVAKAKRMGATAAKLLVYYHPNSAAAHDQDQLVADVAAACRRHDLPLFLEPITHSVDPSVSLLTGEVRREVVIETARRLTAIGGDVLKVEFPYDASVTDEARWADACAELDEASPLPWVLLSGGVDDATFARQVEVACRAGASGVLVGRSVWAEAVRLGGPDRERFLATEGVARLTRLVETIEAHGRPWLDRSPGLRDARVGADWYRDYPEA